MMDTLQQEWQSLCADFIKEEAMTEKLWTELSLHYGASSRHYHNFHHIQDLLTQAKRFAASIEDRPVLLFSIWYHDIIYRPWRQDNELKSAELARKRLAPFDLSKLQVEACFQQILLTKTHDAEAADLDTQLLLDFDLSILGRSQATYERYCQQIRKEYRIFPDFLYRPGRRKALQHFIARPFIYHHPHYREQYEAQARANLRWELAQLS